MQVKNVIIVNDFNYIQGGASKVAIDTAKLLLQNNINVYFFSAVNKKEDEIIGVKYISTNQCEALKEKNKLKGFINGIYNFKAKKYFKELLTEFSNEDTIIHMHGWTKALSSSVFDIANKMNFKIILTLHDYFTACPNGGYFNYKTTKICEERPLSWKCIKCNCDSRSYFFKLYRIIRQFVQNKVVKLNDKLQYAIGISDLNIEVLKETLNKDIYIKKIYNPIEFDLNEKWVDFLKNEEYLYVGRVSKEKGVNIFCEAVTKLNKHGVVVGDGDERQYLEKKYKNISFVGWKKPQEVKEYMKRAKVLIFPSLWYEGAGLTPLEAMSLGIPVLISNVCAAKEFVKDELIFDLEKENDLEEKMKNVDKLEISKDDIKELVLKMNYNNYVKEILKFIREIIEK